MIQITFDLNGDIDIDASESVTYGFAKKYDADADGIADTGAAPLGRRAGAGPLPMAPKKVARSISSAPTAASSGNALRPEKSTTTSWGRRMAA